MDRPVWVGAPAHLSSAERKGIITAALEQGFHDILVGPGDEPFAKLARFNALTVKGGTILAGDREVGRFVTIARGEDELRARDLRGTTPFVVVAAEDWRVIPLENLIAHFQGSGTGLIMRARTPEEAKLFLETMEVGADGLLFVPDHPGAMRELRELLEARLPQVELEEAEVVGLRQVGLGDRVCVDTCSLLDQGEGILVGNSAQGLFLLGAETVESEYVAPRPFRVNAGPVHAYVLLPDSRTKYLSEVRAGDEVLAADRSGRTRAVVVGRCKVERRPLVLVEARAGDRRYTTILQNAETIRLVTPDGMRSVAELRPGERVLLRTEEGGRHFGMRLKETIVER